MFGSYLRGMLRVDYSYQDEFFTKPSNDPFFAADSQNLVSARLGLSDADRNWEATLWGRNLTDDDNINYSVQNAPHGLVINSSTGIIQWTPDYTQAGVFTLIITISDNDYSFSRAITINIKNVKKIKY